MSSRGFSNTSLAESRARRALAALSTSEQPATPRRPSSLATGPSSRTSGISKTSEVSTSGKDKVAATRATGSSTGKTPRPLNSKTPGKDGKFEFDTWKKYINEEEKKNIKAGQSKNPKVKKLMFSVLKNTAKHGIK